jgi:hypothetical protein
MEMLLDQRFQEMADILLFVIGSDTDAAHQFLLG